MKKKLSLFLAIAMLLTMFMPLTSAEAKTKAKGPNKAWDSSAYVLVKQFKILSGGDEVIDNDIYFYASNMMKEEFGCKQEKLKGLSYNAKNNTLTIKNFKDEYAIIIANEMGDNFKIKVLGNNEVGSIITYGNSYGGSLTLTGNGKLKVNKSDISILGAISVHAENTASGFTCGKKVKLEAYGVTSEEGLVTSIAVSGTTKENKVIDFKGKKINSDKLAIGVDWTNTCYEEPLDLPHPDGEKESVYALLYYDEENYYAVSGLNYEDENGTLIYRICKWLLDENGIVIDPENPEILDYDSGDIDVGIEPVITYTGTNSYYYIGDYK